MVIPSGIVSTIWPAVYDQIRKFGDEFDLWQQNLGSLALGRRADGDFAATVGGITLSIARQVAKTFMIGRIIFALCVLFPNLTVIWTAHRLRTSDETFKKLSALAKRPSVAKFIDGKPREANGQQEIPFKNCSRILFGAREGGFGRGFDEVDILVFDEAQILTDKALEDMVAATNQSRWEFGALVFYMGTPPRPIDPGEAFTLRRSDALEIRAGAEYGPPSIGEDSVYIECSADADADPDDREQWKKGNPSYPARTPLRSMLRLRKNLPSEESWLREGLGIWDAKGSEQVIAAADWQARADTNSLPSSKFVLSIDVDPDQKRGAVAFAGLRKDGLIHVELDEQRAGIGWIAPYVAERYARNEIAAVVIDSKSPAASLVEDLARLKVRRVALTQADDMATACGKFYEMATEGGLVHLDQPQMNVSLASARKRSLGDRWAWNRKTVDADITPIVAATLAVWGVQTKKVRGGTPRGQQGERRVVTW